MKINKSYKFRIYPTDSQKEFLTNQFGCCRFVYNYFLRKRIDFYAENKDNKKKSLTYKDTCAQLTQLKNIEQFSWLTEGNSQTLQQSLRHLDVSYHNFFNKQDKFPKFKSKRNKQSFIVPQHFLIQDEKGFINIPKLLPLKTVFHRPIKGTPKSITISQTPSGKYFASILCEFDVEVIPKTTGNRIGIDLGLKAFLVTSDELKIDAPKFFRKSELKLAKAQRVLSRRKKGSNKRNKAKLKVAILYEHISNQRLDFLHKLSSQLVSENQAIFVEDLNVKGMIKNHRLSKSISDVGWSEFLRQLDYKSKWTGTTFFQIDRFFPSSKRCNSCGWINEDLKLSDRIWNCSSCNSIVDRDYNAAKNILQFGELSMIGKDIAESITPKKIRT